MIVFYHPENLDVIHSVANYAEQYRKWLTDPKTEHRWPFVIIDEPVAFEEVEITAGGQWRRRKPIGLDATPAKVVVGEVATVPKIPKGVTVEVNGDVAGVTKKSQPLDLSFDTPGFYRVRLSGPGYIAQEFEIEAEAPN